MLLMSGRWNLAIINLCREDDVRYLTREFDESALTPPVGVHAAGDEDPLVHPSLGCQPPASPAV